MRIEATGASPEEVAAIVAALDALHAQSDSRPAERFHSRWRAAARAYDDGYDALRSGRSTVAAFEPKA